ncbi:hypothetical protein DFR48_102278 [Ciceribacter lividus]|uniref:Uncharacterized protein n=1 Tax=Ciceribacter lividus TaxID=1197950 RepID=A0A6I7HSQ1_9HYPH|nr:hypothetical protein [Ciceribacter lividus]RCW27792.1 hypothetical protein DFR48_102278 [Ciceribacter lividus]
MATGREYFIEDKRFTPSQFRRLSKARQIVAMVQWFQSQYEDPAQETPYNGREGGFLWVHGGPYDADAELQGEFSDLVDFEIIQQAVDEVTSDGIYEWAPIRHNDHPDEDYGDDSVSHDHDDGIYSLDEPLPDISEFIDDEDDEAQFPELPPGQDYLTDEQGRVLTDEHARPLIVGTPGALAAGALNEYVINGPAYAGGSFATENGGGIVDVNENGLVPSPTPNNDGNAAYQQELRSRIERLEIALETYSNNLAPRDHNRPPELVEPDPIAPSDFKIIVEAVIELKGDALQERPDPVRLEAKASLFRRVAGAIAAWCGRKADAAVDAGIQWAIPAGIVWVAANPQEVQAALNAVAEAAAAWADYLSGGIL